MSLERSYHAVQVGRPARSKTNREEKSSHFHSQPWGSTSTHILLNSTLHTEALDHIIYDLVNFPHLHMLEALIDLLLALEVLHGQFLYLLEESTPLSTRLF